MYSTVVMEYQIVNTAQKMKFSIKDFFHKCDQICTFLRIWSHLLKKSLMKNFFSCAVSRKSMMMSNYNKNLKNPFEGNQKHQNSQKRFKKYLFRHLFQDLFWKIFEILESYQNRKIIKNFSRKTFSWNLFRSLKSFWRSFENYQNFRDSLFHGWARLRYTSFGTIMLTKSLM